MGVIQDSLLPVHSIAGVIEAVSIVTLSASEGSVSMAQRCFAALSMTGLL